MTTPRFDWTDAELGTELRSLVARPMPRGQGILTYRRPLAHLDRPFVDGKRHILFVSYYPSANILKKCMTLRDTGDYFITFIGCCIREDTEIHRWTDQAFEVNTFMDLYPLLHNAAPFAAHVQSPHPLCAATALDALPMSTPAVLDLYDSQRFLHTSPSAFACRLEQAMLRRVHAFCHKMPAVAIENIRAAWGITCPDVEVQSLPCRAFFQTPSAPRKNNASAHLLAYAGGVMPRHIALRDGHANQIFDPFIEACLRQGLNLEMYVNQNARDMFFHEHETYLTMARQPGFCLHPGAPFHQISRLLASFHYGVLYDNIDLSSYRDEAFSWNFSTKIYSYMEAGIPLLLMDSFTAMTDMVVAHKVGIPYSVHRLDNLSALLDAAEWEEMTGHVAAFREEHELSTIAPRLMQLYDGIQQSRSFV